MKKERVVNIRFLFCVFVGLMLGIIFSRLFLLDKINTFVYVLSIFLVIGLMVGLVVYARKTSQFNKAHKSRKNVSFLIACSSIGFAVAYFVGLIICIFPINTLKSVHVFESNVGIQGIVSGYVDRESTYTKFILSDCEYYEDDVCINSDFQVIVYTGVDVDIELGDNVSFVAEIDNLDYSNEFDFSKLSQGIAYSTYVNADDLVIGSGVMTFRDKVHRKVKTILKDELNEDNAEICFSILFGQKYGLSEGMSNIFSYAGISHILAVSGLHVGVLVSLIWFLFRKIRMNKYVHLILFGIILLFYSYLCLFSPSVCRASIMAFVLALTKTFFWEYDILSSLSIAGIIILLFNPLALFSVSFQLSFMCLFAIITLAPTMQRLFQKIKLPKVLASGLAVSIAVNLVILPICVNYFDSISLLGVFTNIFVLPVFSLTYVLLFISVLFSLIIPPLSVMLFFPNLFLHLIKAIAIMVSKINFGVFRLFRVSYYLVFILSITTLALHFWMVKWRFKSIIIATLLVAFVSLFATYMFPKSYESDKLIVASQYKSNVLIYVGDSGVTLIGSDIESDDLKFMMKKLRIDKINTIIAYDLQLNKINELVDIKKVFEVEKIVSLFKFDYNELEDDLGNIEYFEDNYQIDNLNLYTKKYENDIVALDIDINDTDFLVSIKSNSTKENYYLIETCSGYDYYILDDKDLWYDNEELLWNIVNIADCDTMILG
jgi:ComEC/Rec2-related protein